MSETIHSWSDVPVNVLHCTSKEMNLANTLDCGQAFRWRRDMAGKWSGVIGARVFRLWRSDADLLSYQAWPFGATAEGVLHDYLRLDVDLDAVQSELGASDSRLTDAFHTFPGMRVLAQDPQEMIFTFLCSPANNVTRITRSIDLLCRHYGQGGLSIDGEPFHLFPASSRFAEETVGGLVANGALGFRGKNIHKVARMFEERSPAWLSDLAAASYRDARAALIELPGVGPKIADCIALFGLRHDDAVPVDTHVWGIAREIFPDRFSTSTVTPATYDDVREAFLERYGRWAGWAQQYLFHARRVERSLPTPSTVNIATNRKGNAN